MDQGYDVDCGDCKDVRVPVEDGICEACAEDRWDEFVNPPPVFDGDY